MKRGRYLLLGIIISVIGIVYTTGAYALYQTANLSFHRVRSLNDAKQYGWYQELNNTHWFNRNGNQTMVYPSTGDYMLYDWYWFIEGTMLWPWQLCYIGKALTYAGLPIGIALEAYELGKRRAKKG